MKSPVGGVPCASYFECMRLDLAHGRLGRSAPASEATEAAFGIERSKDQARRDGSPQEPHEGGAGLDLATPLLDVPRAAKGDPIAAVVAKVDAAAVGGAELGGQDDGGDKGEDDGEAVEGEEEHGDGEGADKGGTETDDDGNPAPGGGEHGVVDGGLAAVDVGGLNIADKGGDEEEPDEGEGPEGDLNNVGHGVSLAISRWIMVFFLSGYSETM